jgi:hypothetical protein
MNDQMFQSLKLLPQCAAHKKKITVTEDKICMHLPLMNICITEIQA